MIFCGALVSSLIWPANAGASEDSSVCEKTGYITFNVETAQRIEGGDFLSLLDAGQCRKIIRLEKGALQGYGSGRWWGVDEKTALADSYLGVYNQYEILHPITSKNGFILNAEPNDTLRELFKEQGVELPVLSDNAVRVTVDGRPSSWNWWYFNHLRVRTEPTRFSPTVDNVVNGQSVWITDVVLGGRYGYSVWGKVYSLYSDSDVWISLGHFGFNLQEHFWWSINIRKNDWNTLSERYYYLGIPKMPN